MNAVKEWVVFLLGMVILWVVYGVLQVGAMLLLGYGTLLWVASWLLFLIAVLVALECISWLAGS